MVSKDYLKTLLTSVRQEKSYFKSLAAFYRAKRRATETLELSIILYLENSTEENKVLFEQAFKEYYDLDKSMPQKKPNKRKWWLF